MEDYTTQFYRKVTTGMSDGGGNGGGGSGRIFYVDPTGGSSSNSGTSAESPWSSFADVNAYAATHGFQPGDTILFARGEVYDSPEHGFWVNFSGSADAPITLGAYGDGEPPLFTNSRFVDDGTGKDASTSDCILNIEATASNIVVTDLHFANPAGSDGVITDAAIRSMGTNIQITNCEIEGVGTGIYFLRTDGSASNSSADHNYIHDLTMVINTPGGSDDRGAQGILIEASGVTIINNSFVNLNAPSYDFVRDGAAVELFGPVSGVIVRGNYFENIDTMVEVGSNRGGTVSNITFDHNIVNGFNSIGTFHNGGDGFSVRIESFFIDANTFYGAVNDPAMSSAAFWFSASDASFLRLADNIFSVQSTDFWSLGATNYQHSNNLYDTGSLTFPSDYFSSGNEYVGQPAFADAANRDFRLLATSDALSRAIALAGEPVDYMGHNLVGRANLDIGAIEYWTDGAIAANDRFATTEAAAIGTGLNLFANNGSGADSGTALAIAAVNGSAAAVGMTITLASGALLKVNVDGTFRYDPNHAFDYLTPAGSGSSNAAAIDQFSYTLANGTTATVTIDVSGLRSAGDVILGTVGSDTIVGTTLADIINGGDGNDTLSGGNGDDRLIGGTGADTMAGGAGNDSYVVDNASDKVTELSGAGTDSIESSIGWTLGNYVENLTLTGSSHVNAIGNSLANQLIGNAGNNLIDGKGGADTMAGGGGNDTYVVDNSGDRVSEATNQGIDTVQSSVNFTLGDNIENLTLIGGATGVGNLLANTIMGNSAANSLWGGGGNDRIEGGGGNDKLYGEAGSDTLVGGAGKDTFYFTSALNNIDVDQILDFIHGTDKIALDDALFKGMPLGSLSSAAFCIGTAAADSSDRIVYDPGTGWLSYDADGAGGQAAVHFATVTPGTNLTASDFIIM